MISDKDPEPVTEGICWLCLEEGQDPRETKLFKTPRNAPACLGHARSAWQSYLGVHRD